MKNQTVCVAWNDETIYDDVQIIRFQWDNEEHSELLGASTERKNGKIIKELDADEAWKLLKLLEGNVSYEWSET